MTARPPRKVVALVPAWKAAHFIEPTLAALAAQTHDDFEVLISDDASPDETAVLCEGFAARDPRFRLIRQPVNLGWVGNVNALLAAAKGEYFTFAFQDDLPEPTYFERGVAALEAEPDAILSFSDIALVHADGRREEKRYTELDGITDRLERARSIARQNGSWWIPNRGVFRARAAAAIGGLRRHAAGEFSADWPWLLHMSLLGSFARVPERLVTKIYVAQSLSRSWRFGARQWAAVTLSAMESVRRAQLPWAEAAAVNAELTAFAAGCIGRSMRRMGREALQAAGARRKAVAEPDDRQ
jgi:glycosyltransferase involved in cell wall biosynthesis